MMFRRRFHRTLSLSFVFVDHMLQARDLNRLQLHVQQLEHHPLQAVSHGQNVSGDVIHCNSSAPFVTTPAYHTPNSNTHESVRLILESGASRLRALSAYATSASVAEMQQPDLSLQAVAAAANLMHERAAVRKGRVHALTVVDLCGSSALSIADADKEGASLKRRGRCLQVVRLITCTSSRALLTSAHFCRRHLMQGS
jgi:hypothetical protein